MKWAMIKEFININFSWEENKPTLRIVIPILRIGMSINLFYVKK